MADGTVFGVWQSVFSGFGCVSVVNVGSKKILHQNPKISSAANQTSASLVVGSNLTAPFTYQGQFQTTAQLRQGSVPNPWEVAWLIWNYTDTNHFYYFIAQTNGWELGKRDPAYMGGQRFLTTGALPAYPIGSWHTFKVTFSLNNTMSVYIDNVLITNFQDTATPYTTGKIGLYNEDAAVNFSDIATMNTDAPIASTTLNLVGFP